MKDLEIQLCARMFLFARMNFLQLDHSDFDLSMTDLWLILIVVHEPSGRNGS